MRPNEENSGHTGPQAQQPQAQQPQAQQPQAQQPQAQQQQPQTQLQGCENENSSAYGYDANGYHGHGHHPNGGWAAVHTAVASVLYDEQQRFLQYAVHTAQQAAQQATQQAAQQAAQYAVEHTLHATVYRLVGEVVDPVMHRLATMEKNAEGLRRTMREASEMRSEIARLHKRVAAIEGGGGALQPVADAKGADAKDAAQLLEQVNQAAKDTAESVARSVVKESVFPDRALLLDLTKTTASETAKLTAEQVAKDIAKDIAKDVAKDVAKEAVAVACAQQVSTPASAPASASAIVKLTARVKDLEKMAAEADKASTRHEQAAWDVSETLTTFRRDIDAVPAKITSAVAAAVDAAKIATKDKDKDDAPHDSPSSAARVISVEKEPKSPSAVGTSSKKKRKGGGGAPASTVSSTPSSSSSLSSPSTTAKPVSVLKNARRGDDDDFDAVINAPEALATRIHNLHDYVIEQFAATNAALAATDKHIRARFNEFEDRIGVFSSPTDSYLAQLQQADRVVRMRDGIDPRTASSSPFDLKHPVWNMLLTRKQSGRSLVAHTVHLEALLLYIRPFLEALAPKVDEMENAIGLDYERKTLTSQMRKTGQADCHPDTSFFRPIYPAIDVLDSRLHTLAEAVDTMRGLYASKIPRDDNTAVATALATAFGTASHAGAADAAAAADVDTLPNSDLDTDSEIDNELPAYSSDGSDGTDVDDDDDEASFNALRRKCDDAIATHPLFQDKDMGGPFKSLARLPPDELQKRFPHSGKISDSTAYLVHKYISPSADSAADSTADFATSKVSKH